MESNRVYESEVFENIELNNEILENTKFIECEFVGCKIQHSTLRVVKFLDCKFKSCSIINIKFQSSQFQNIDFLNCNINGINWKTLESNRQFIPVIKSLKKSFLKYSIFYDMDLKNFDFEGNNFCETLFNRCNLEGANFKNCNFDGSEFKENNLKKSQFKEAYGYNIDINSNELSGAKFSFPEVIKLLESLNIEID